MSDELMIPADSMVPAKYSDEQFDKLAAASFLPRIQVMGGNTDAVKEGKIEIGTYAIVQGQDNFVQLGKQIDVLVISWRPMALDTNDPVISVYDPESDLFKKIQTKSDVPNSGAMWGFQFLLWLAEKKEFVTFFLASKSARRVAPQLRALIGKAATLKVQLIKNDKYSWHNALVTTCSTPFELPPLESVKEQAQKFNNPPEQEIETAEADGRAR